MSYFVTKTLLAVLFVAAGLTAALSMLTLMGRPQPRPGAPSLRNAHRIAGYVFVTLLILLALMGLRHLSAKGDSLSVRGVLHWSLASLLLFVVALKLAVVRWFRQFLKFVPVMGMIVITLALAVAMLSAVFFMVTGGIANPDDGTAQTRKGPAEVVMVTAPTEASGDAAEGGRIFEKNCSNCHYSDSTDRKVAEGLAGLFARDQIEVSGAPMSAENVRAQIVDPAGGMPSFKSYLSDRQLDDVVAYLMTL